MYEVTHFVIDLLISGQSGRVLPMQGGGCWGHGYENGLCAIGSRYEAARLWRGNGGEEETSDTKEGKEGGRNGGRGKGEPAL